jgi:hypothetical protein
VKSEGEVGGLTLFLGKMNNPTYLLIIWRKGLGGRFHLHSSPLKVASGRLVGPDACRGVTGVSRAVADGDGPLGELRGMMVRLGKVTDNELGHFSVRDANCPDTSAIPICPRSRRDISQ